MARWMTKFAKDESGAETMEWLAVLAAGAALIGIAYKAGAKVKSRMKGVGADL